MKSDLAKLRHARSVKDFPDINLEADEYMKLAICRSPIMIVLIWAGEALAIVGLFALLIFLQRNSTSGPVFQLDQNGQSFLLLCIYVLMGVTLIAGLISTHVYRRNKIFITNKRLIQQTATSLFISSTNIIELVSIEDVSFKQSGIIDYIFKIGTLRMSTVGEETTYTLKYVDSPNNELEVITHLVHVEKERDKNSSKED